MTIYKMKNLKHFFFIIFFIFLVISCKEESTKTSNYVYTINININGNIPTKKMAKAIFNYEKGKNSKTIIGKIKRRGGYSMSFPKHSYEIDFKEDIPLADLPADDDWILNANHIDKTFLRHVISYELFTDMDENNMAPRCQYVNLYLNNEYKGLYVLMEKVDKSSLQIKSKDSTAFIFKEPHLFRNSYEGIRPQKKNNFHQQTFPKKLIKDQGYHLESLRDFIIKSDNNLFSKKISEKLDINNIIDWHLLLLISNNSDGILKNFYLYKQDNNTPMKIAPWDYDHSFGRDGDNELNLDRVSLNIKRSILFERLLQFDWYKKKLKKRWVKLNTKDILSTKGLQKRIIDKSSFIKKYAQANFEVWPVDSKIYYDKNNFDQEIEIMLKFIKIRHHKLDVYFKSID